MSISELRAELDKLWEKITDLSEEFNKFRLENTQLTAQVTQNFIGQLNSISNEISLIKEKLLTIKDERSKEKFVSKEEFFPIKHLVYAFVSLVLLGVVTTLIKTVLPHADFPG